MSGRIISHRLTPLLRKSPLSRHVHNYLGFRTIGNGGSVGAGTGGLLRVDGAGSAAVRGRGWPVGVNAIHHLNVVAVRNISFARILPRLALKLARIPAMLGGAMIAGLAYIQYQASGGFFRYKFTYDELTAVV